MNLSSIFDVFGSEKDTVANSNELTMSDLLNAKNSATSTNPLGMSNVPSMYPPSPWATIQNNQGLQGLINAQMLAGVGNGQVVSQELGRVMVQHFTVRKIANGFILSGVGGKEHYCESELAVGERVTAELVQLHLSD